MHLPDPPKPRRRLFGSLRSNFLTGLIVIAPIGITIWLIWTLTGWIDSWVLPFIPDRYNPSLLINEKGPPIVLVPPAILFAVQCANLSSDFPNVRTAVVPRRIAATPIAAKA